MSQANSKVAVVDDCPMFFDFIKQKINKHIGNIEFVYFTDPDSFLDHLSKKPTDFNFLIVDRYIKSYDIFNDDFVQTCKTLGYEGAISLVSSAPPASQDEKDQNERFDYVLAKSRSDMIFKLIDMIKNYL